MVTHEKILALMVLKDERIIALEERVAALTAELENARTLVAAARTSPLVHDCSHGVNTRRTARADGRGVPDDRAE